EPGCVCTGVLTPGGPPVLLIRSKYSGAVIGGTGPISATWLPPGDDPPFGPSVKSQTLPATSAASPVGPAAACACASVGKLSMRQNNGPGGNCWTFFSATGLISNFCAEAVDGDSANPVIAAAIHVTSARRDRRAILHMARLRIVTTLFAPSRRFERVDRRSFVPGRLLQAAFLHFARKLFLAAP